MKRSTIGSIALILCLALLCPLTACSDSADLLRLDGAERADAFFDIVNADPADAYKVGMDMKIEGSLYGVELEANIESDSVYIGYKTDTPVYHSESSSEISVGSGDDKTLERTSSVSGYRDGKLYEMSERDGTKSALISSVSAEDFKAHREFLVGYSDEELETLHKSASVKECVKNEDGTWSASFSGYPEESILALVDYAFDPTVLLLDGWEVRDIIFTVESDAEFLPTDWDYEIVFEKTDGDYPEPEAKTEIEFYDIGIAAHPGIDISAYTEVEGLTDLQKIRALLADKLISDSDSFTSVSSQKVSYDSTTQHTKETDVVTVRTENGAYTFNIDAEVYSPGVVGATNVTIAYKNGQFTMSGKNITTQSQEMSDSAARAYISRLYDPAGLSSAQISDISKRTDGHDYLFTLAAPDYSALEASLSSLGAGNIQASANVGVDYADGKLTAYEYTMTVTARVSGRTMTIEITSSIEFDN